MLASPPAASIGAGGIPVGRFDDTAHLPSAEGGRGTSLACDPTCAPRFLPEPRRERLSGHLYRELLSPVLTVVAATASPIASMPAVARWTAAGYDRRRGRHQPAV